jgi:hypothetical protein
MKMGMRAGRRYGLFAKIGPNGSRYLRGVYPRSYEQNYTAAVREAARERRLTPEQRKAYEDYQSHYGSESRANARSRLARWENEAPRKRESSVGWY